MGELGFWNLAAKDPDRIALVDPEHETSTAGELAALSNRLVHGLRAAGLRQGDVVAALLPNSSELVALYLAVMQSGLYLVPINYHLTGPEAAYIVSDSQAKVFIAGEVFAEVAARGARESGLAPDAWFSVGAIDGFRPLGELVDGMPDTPPLERTSGNLMNYTSGTTGRPKGVKRPLLGLDPDVEGEQSTWLTTYFGIEPGLDSGHVHLVVAPLYHTAVLVFAAKGLHAGHQVVLMDRWTPEGTLERVQRYRVTWSHMVPTMFHRMLGLPDEVRASFDTSSLSHVIHSAAPCPVPTKRRMIEWLGPVIYEYYAATEGGGTFATPQEWMAKPGTVGKPWPVSEVKILDDDGNELDTGEIGTVWMSMGEKRFEYHGDKEKTARSWRGSFFTVGDAGYVDADGWLFLCDRKIDMIISGGVNIYPAETEAVLLQHPDVADAAVFGIPHAEWGEEVKAVVQPNDPGADPADLEERLLAWCADQLARYKCPRTIDVTQDFPRDPNGKVYKRKLRDPYWVGHERAI